MQEIRCDMCGEVLVGMKGRVQISKSYLEIAGFVRDWQADPDTGWREYTYVSPPDKRQMAFCTDDDATCFMDYVHMKREAQRVHREQKLREGATAEFNDRATMDRFGAPPPYNPPRRDH